ncbi:MAG: hypothetical protein WEC15_04805, partial [Flavobacteriales bacterium]
MNRPYRYLLTLTFIWGLVLAASTQAQSVKMDVANGAIHGTVGQLAAPSGQPLVLGQGSALGAPPPNNLCTEAVIVSLAGGGSEVRTGDNTGATDELGFGVGQAWEAFTTTECLDVTIAYCGTDPIHQGVFNLLAIGCPLANFAFTGDGFIEQSNCGDGNFTLTFPELPAGTYYYPILTAPGATGPYTITFSAVACTATTPANDDCGGATVLIPNPDCITSIGNVAGANAGVSLPAITCAGFTGIASDDVWYTFVATATAHTIVVQGSVEFDPTVDFRSGICGETTTMACSDATGRGGVEILNAAGLDIGQTYYVRVNDWYGGLPLTTTFTICVLGPAPGSCAADAGTLAPASTTTCLEEGSVDLVATPSGDANVPTGFETVFVLTQGTGLVISGTSVDPSFNVTEVGNYTIHTLVFDPTTLDLSIVEPGVTTGFELDALLQQGGGNICASLDVAGAAFIVLEDCSGICPADAGSLMANTTNVCIEDGQAILLATPQGEIVVPAGYEVLYILTQGEDLVIVNAESAPFFGVSTPGTYTIHTLVYDANTLDLGIVELGVTTGFDVNSLLIQGGGTICASLDVAGAAFTVEMCVEPCDADAGTLSGGATVCLENGSTTLMATADGNANVPPGYNTVYVLTEGAGLVIVQAGATPEFTVDAEGTYTIHTLVYDANTLDLGIVELGVTTGFDVNGLLIQGGGAICASLDVAGAAFTLLDCTPSNDNCNDAILVLINQSCLPVLGDNTYSTENADNPSCDNSTVGYADVWYRFSSGDNSTLDILLEPGTMTDWGIVVTEGCSGEEVFCEVQPNGSITLDVLSETEYTIRVFSNLQFGEAGSFELCVVGAIPSVNCEAGSISTTFGTALENVCQDGEADVITFSTTSISDQNYTYIVTDDAGSILTPLAGNALDFNGAPLGTYRVWGISFSGTLQGATPGANIADVSATGT